MHWPPPTLRAPRRQTSTSSLTMARSCRRGISGCPVCSGSRAALMTGRQCVRRNRIHSLPPQFTACRRRARGLCCRCCRRVVTALLQFKRVDTRTRVSLYRLPHTPRQKHHLVIACATQQQQVHAHGRFSRCVCSAPLWRRVILLPLMEITVAAAGDQSAHQICRWLSHDGH